MPKMIVGNVTVEFNRAFFGPGARVDVSDTDVAALVALGCTIVEAEAAPEDIELQMKLDDEDGTEPISLEEAFAMMEVSLAGGTGQDYFTQDGRPDVRVLKQLTGLPITADERDAAWAGYKAAHLAPEIDA
ncbi:MAG: hypothetical protein RLN89_03545 [Parvibaculum sp.]